jgi:protein-S-isoprenylcysteine O-methyltransferase Ste14
MKRRRLKKIEKPVLAKKYNVSYLGPDSPRPPLGLATRHYISAAIVYGTALLVLTFSPYFRRLLNVQFHGVSAAAIYWYIFAAYLIIGAPIFFLIRPKSLWVSNPVRITNYITRLGSRVFKLSSDDEAGSWKPTYEETHAMVFMLVKMIYGPLAVNAAIAGYNNALPIIKQLHLQVRPADYFDIIYRLFITLIFMIEALPYIISYHTDSKLFGNKLRYVETNPFHLFVCLACYPPFSYATVEFLGISFNDPFSIVWAGNINHPMTWILRILAMISAALLLSASLTLFTRASNLTNRGIVTWGPYRIVRHPGYISKNIYWLLTFIPALIPNTAAPQFSWSGYATYFIMTAFGFVGWATLYFFRGITEERFLMRDPEYIAYCKKVKYHFIPFVY